LRRLSAGMKDGFNPRPRMGGDAEDQGLQAGQGQFQSTPPHGGRPFMGIPAACRLGVSIHAPAWGATFGGTFWRTGKRCFNPRPRMGGDLWRNLLEDRQTLFQSTPPHGGRQERGAALIFVEQVSIHAPAWGATEALWRMGLTGMVSIHAPAWGATCLSRQSR